MPRRNRECGCCCTPTIVPVVSMTGQAENELRLPGVNDNVVRVTSGTGSAVFGPMRFRHCRVNLALNQATLTQDQSGPPPWTPVSRYQIQPSRSEIRLWCDDDGDGAAATLVVTVEHGGQYEYPLVRTTGYYEEKQLQTHLAAQEISRDFLGFVRGSLSLVELIVTFELRDRAGASVGSFAVPSTSWIFNPVLFPGIPARNPLQFMISATMSDDNTVDLAVSWNDFFRAGLGDFGSDDDESYASRHLFSPINDDNTEPPSGSFVYAECTQSIDCSCDLTIYDQQGRSPTTPCLPVDASAYCDESAEGYVGPLTLYPWSKDSCTHWVRPSRVTHAECASDFSSMLLSFGGTGWQNGWVATIIGDYELTGSGDVGDLVDNEFWFSGPPNVPIGDGKEITRLELSAKIMTRTRGISMQYPVHFNVCEGGSSIVPTVFLTLFMNVKSADTGDFLYRVTATHSFVAPLSFLRGDPVDAGWTIFAKAPPGGGGFEFFNRIYTEQSVVRLIP